MTTPTDPRIELVARTLDETALATVEQGGLIWASTIREAAAELVEKLDAHRRVESEEDAVRVVDAVLDQCLVEYGDGHRALVEETATRIVRALLGTGPIGTETEEVSTGVRTVTLQWPSDDVRVALVAREVLDAMVDEANAYRAGADLRSIPEGVELTPAQAYGYLLTAPPERRHELLADLMHQRSRGVRCWLHGHEETIDNLRRDLDVARAQLAERHDEVRAALPPALVGHAVKTSPGVPMTDEQRADLAVGIGATPPVWPDPEVAVDLIDHTDEERPVVPCGDPEHCASHGKCIDYADELTIERDADEEPST